MPQAEIRPFQPTMIENRPAAPPAESADDAVTKKRTTPIAANEFEAFVSSAAGKPLRRFGAELLVPGARDFTVAPTTIVPPDYRLNPGDELLLGLTGSVQAADLRLTIDQEGRIFLPRVGAIAVGGVRYGDVRDVIARQVTRQYRGFDLQVSVGRLHGITVYVTGFCGHPGSYTVGSLSTLVNAVLAAGGPSSGGSFRSIQLRRDGKLVSDFDLYDLLLKGDKSGDAALQNGDVIYVAPAGEQVAVIGSVNRGGDFRDRAERDAQGRDRLCRRRQHRRRRQPPDGARSAGQVGCRLAAGDCSRSADAQGETWRCNLNPLRCRHRPPARPAIGAGDDQRRSGTTGPLLFPPRHQAGGCGGAGRRPHLQAFPYASVVTRESVKAQQAAELRPRDQGHGVSAHRSAGRLRQSRAACPTGQSPPLVRSIVDQLRAREPSGRLVFDLPVAASTLPGDVIVENNDTI